MAITLDGTSGITTPDVNSDGLTVDSTTLVVDEANNRVGIGTSSPVDRVDIGSGRFAASSDTTTPTGGSAYFYKQSNGATVSGYQVLLETGSAGSRAERARIDSSGRVLMNTTSSLDNNYTLHVKIASGTGGIVIKKIGSGTEVPITFYNSVGSGVGNILATESSVSYNSSSDYRLKENVVGVTGASARVQQLNPVRFNFIADPDTTVDGFLAHEVQDVVPEAITGTRDEVDAEGNPVYQGIDQSKLVPLLTAALQEALTKIETLEARVAALEAA